MRALLLASLALCAPPPHFQSCSKAYVMSNHCSSMSTSKDVILLLLIFQINNKSCSTGPWKWLWILLVVIVLGSGLLSMKYRPVSSINYEITDVKPMKRLYSNSTWIKEHVSRETCISGHIQNMVPICGADGCLKVTSTLFYLNIISKIIEYSIMSVCLFVYKITR